MPETPPNIVLIHGVPRSGTSWLGQIFNSHEDVAFRYQPLFSHAFKDRLHLQSSPEDISDFLQDLTLTDDPFVLGRSSEVHGSYPTFHKSDSPTHLVIKHVRYHHLLSGLLEQNDNLKVVALVRHPCAVMQSWLKAPREFLPHWNPIEEWLLAPRKNQERPEEFNGFERWKNATRLFMRLQREYPERFTLVRYRDLLADPIDTTDRFFRFAGLNSSLQTAEFLDQSTSRQIDDPYAVFKIKTCDDAWKDRLDSLIADAILADTKGTDLEFFLE